MVQPAASWVLAAVRCTHEGLASATTAPLSGLMQAEPAAAPTRMVPLGQVLGASAPPSAARTISDAMIIINMVTAGRPAAVEAGPPPPQLWGEGERAEG